MVKRGERARERYIQREICDGKEEKRDGGEAERKGEKRWGRERK